MLEAVSVLPKNMLHPRDKDPDRDAKAVYAITAGESGLLKIWDLVGKQIVYQQTNSTNPLGIDYSILDREASQLFVVTNDQNIIVYGMEELLPQKTLVGFNDEIIDVKYLSASEIVTATNSEQIKCFTIPDFACRVLGQSQSSGIQHKDTVLCLAVSRDGRFIASGSKDQKVIIWDAKTGNSVLQLVGHAADVTCLTFFNKTSQYLVTGSKDLTWKLWDLSIIDDVSHSDVVPVIDSSVVTIKAHNKDINAVAVAPTDGLLATAGQDKVIKLYKLGGDGNIAAVQEMGSLVGHRRGVWDATFSAVDKVLLSSSGDKTIKLWSLQDFSCLKSFEGHTATVLRVAFVTAGLQVLSAGADGLLKLWNISNSECVNTLDQHTEKIWGLAIRNDGEEFVSGAADSVLNIWRDCTVEEAEKEQKTKENAIIAEQNLANSLRKKDYGTALRIAFKLDKPYRVVQIFEQVIDEEGHAKFSGLIADLTPDLIEKLILFVRDWNTNAKHSLVAQNALSEVLKLYSAESLSKMPRIKELLLALVPFSQRHFQRIDRLIENSFILDFVLQSMSFLDDTPAEEKPEEADIADQMAIDAPAEFQNAVEDAEVPVAEEEAVLPTSRKKRRLSDKKPGGKKSKAQ